VFAYGQTSSGKTHTMRGTPEEPGITLLAVRDVFGHIASTQEREFLLRVSYMEARAA
jgi:centromeric protein E